VASKESKRNKKQRTLLQKIVNIFLYIGLGILIIFLLAFGFSQTSTFRDYLKKTVINDVSSSINGKIYIGKIEGTIFTSLILHNTIVNMGKDTLFNIETISLKTSPLRLLLKKIYVRDFEIRDAKISFIKDDSGNLNISKLFPSSGETDTTSSSFPFTIQVANFQLLNVDFSLQNYDKAGSKQTYDSLNMNDLKIKNINLALDAIADINENNFEVEIKKFNAAPNISSFSLNDLSGKFYLNEKQIRAADLEVSTIKSGFVINWEVNKFNLFDSTSSFDTAGINLSLDADSVSFSDLSSFIPSLNFLKGKVVAKVKTSGTLSKTNIDLLEVNYDSTRLNVKGDLRNLDNADKMYITADFYNSFINQSDVNKLMPSLKVPTYPQFGLLMFDTLTYSGNPLNFNSNFYLKTVKGDLSVKANLNLIDPLMAYNIKFKTINFDIEPFASVNTNLNSHGSIKGKGVSPKNLDASINYTADGSILKGNKLDTLRLNATAEKKNIKYKLLAVSDTMSASLEGNLSFANDTPSYKIDGNIRNLNAANITSDSSINTSLNFNINAEGQNFDPDQMNIYLSLKLFNSLVNNIHIDSSRAIVDLRSDDNGQRIVNIISDLADITLSGNFSMEQAATLISGEAELISQSVKKKMDNIFPVGKTGNAENNIVENKNLFAGIDSSANIQYLVDLKNFELISLFLGNKQLEVDGELSGEIRNSKDSISLTLNSRLDYIKFWGSGKVFFLSNFSLNFNLANAFDANSLQDISAEMQLKTDRIFAGSDIKNINLDFNLADNKAKVYLSGGFEDIVSAGISGDMEFSGNTLNLLLDTLSLRYNQFRLLNREAINLSYSENKIDVRNFILDRQNGKGEIKINGILAQSGEQNLKVSLKNLRGRDISQNLFALKPGNTLLGSFNLNSDITGNFENPLIDMDVDLDSVIYKERNLGALQGNFNYRDKNLSVDLKFIDSLNNYKKPELLVTGSIPINLSFTAVEKRLIDNESINLKLTADNFNLAPFGNILPAVRQFRGILNGKLNVSGTFGDIDPEGSITLRDAAFIAQANNLEYYSGLKVDVTKGQLSLDSLVIENSKDTPNGGKMTGSGKAELDNLNIVSSQFSINGMLKVLSESSKDVSPSVYGDLVISTNGNIDFAMNDNGATLKAPINVVNAELTFPPAQGGYKNNTQSYIYKYLNSEHKNESQSPDFESLVKLSQENSNVKEKNSSNGYNFDYNIDVNVEKEAKIIFILSKELNQKLTAVLKGNFKYAKVAEKPVAQGELTLLEGSNLQFFKTLTADGSIRFESELDNPYLDVTATYTDYYTPNDSSSQEEKVAVKIKIQGPIKELDKNFIQEKNNIAVYVGQTAIDNDEPTPDLDASDAVYFIITGRFLNANYVAGGSGGSLSSTSTSLAGSILGGFLNSYLGDYVRSIQVRRVGAQTKVNLTGRVKDFRYTIGGSTDVFQDLSQANVMIEYPIFKSLLVRLERKEALRQTGIQNEMINELGLKYKFEF
jgi:hypothetical protein